FRRVLFRSEVQRAASRPARRVEGNQKLMLPERDLIKWLAIACIAAAVISGGVLGLWEQAHPFFGHSRYQVVAPPFQLWSYSILQVFKALRFLGGLFGLFLISAAPIMIFSRMPRRVAMRNKPNNH